MKFTLALSARSSGPNSTLFASTAALYDAVANANDEEGCSEIRERLERSTTTFAPPPWLPAEIGSEASHSTVQRGPHGSSYYICMDATRSIDAYPKDDREAKAAVWRLTKMCTGPGRVYRHDWDEGDLLIWDNTRTLHARSEYDESNVDRVLYRMRVFGMVEEVVDDDGNSSTRIVCCDGSDVRMSAMPMITDNADNADNDGHAKVDRRKMMTRRRSSKSIQ